MKTINIAELKTHLSRYLRLVRKGERILVLDRKEPIAELIPHAKDQDPLERMASEGRIQLGTQDWRTLHITPMRRLDLQRALDETRGDTV